MHAYDAFAAAYAAAGFDEFSPRLIARFRSRWRRTLPKGARIVDFGCGQGASSRELLSVGFGVVGIDLSFSMLARNRGPCVQANMTRPPFGQVFDAGVCLYDAVNHLHASRLAAFFEAAARVLRPLAPLVFDANTLDGAQLWVEETCLIRKPNVELKIRTEYDAHTHLMLNRVRGWVHEKGRRFDVHDTVEEWYHPQSVLEAAFVRAGFVLEDCYPLFMDMNSPDTPSKWVYEIRAPGVANS